MCFSEERLHCFGARLLKGTQVFPDAVLDLYDETLLSRQAIVEALEAAQAFLEGKEYRSSAPTFGESLKPKRRKRTL